MTKQHPVQTTDRHTQAKAPEIVTLAAYEVYCFIYGEQRAMVEGGCRGGFSAGELIAYLYARGFPKDQWSARVNEAFRGMEHL